MTLKGRFILFNCLILCLVFVNIISAQEIKKDNPLENKIQVELEDKINKLQKEKDALLQTLKEKDKERGEPKDQISILTEKITALEREKVILETMLTNQVGDLLRQPQVVRQGEKNLEKIVHLNLGYAYGLQGKTKEAIAEYQTALAYAPDDKDIHYNLGYLLAKERRYKEAIEEYKKSLKGLPQDSEVYYNLAIIYATGLKDQKTASEYYQKFLTLSSTDTSLSPQQIEEPLSKK